jgi:hypothetical protein
MALELALDSMLGLPHSREALRRLEVSRKRENCGCTVLVVFVRDRRARGSSFCLGLDRTGRVSFPFLYCLEHMPVRYNGLKVRVADPVSLVFHSSVESTSGAEVSIRL